MNVARSQDTRSIYKIQLYIYVQQETDSFLKATVTMVEHLGINLTKYVQNTYA